MTLAIIAGIIFLAHVAVWLGLPGSPAESVATGVPGEMMLESA